MFDFTEAKLEKIAIHKIGNKIQDEDLILSEDVITVDEEIKELLKKYFLSNFKSEEFNQFHHDSDLNLNEVFSFSRHIFDQTGGFFDLSVSMAKHLYNQTDHPNIKAGELYIAHITDCIVDDELVDAIGIFKSENKETYIKIYQEEKAFSLDKQEGININKLDKGCLIFNTEKEFGYKVAVIDKTNKDETKYWNEKFLNVKPLSNKFYQTNNYLNLCKSFVKEVFNTKNEVEKTDQIELLNRSIEYFKEEEVFDENQFKSTVLTDHDVKEAFNEFKDKYETDNCISFTQSFSISEQAVKGQQKNFKSILKLDKNFHIYIHGNKELVEKGFDKDKQMNFYKLFFEKEA
ncbi:MAG: nucleoid-associated protein [Bacteroidales bacterium]|nr:nucleoid-associated protein [Bacteroidales bacterium]